MGYAHRLRDLDKRAVVQGQLVAFVQLVAVFVVGIAEEVPGQVVDHDAVVERVELEKAIVPSLLLAADVVGEETAKLGDGRRVLRGGDGGDGGGVLVAAERSRHGTGWRTGRVAGRVESDMEAGVAEQRRAWPS